jgi:hypothetical protein
MSATRDLRSNLSSDLFFYSEFTVNDTLTGFALDTADYDGGIMLSFAVPAYTDGSYTIEMYQSDNESMNGKVLLSSENLIGSIPVLTSVTNEGDSLETLGIVGTQRYVQANVEGTSITTGASILIMANKMHEILPVT